MQILRNQALDLVGVVPAMENDWSVIPIDMKWEIFFDQSGEKNVMPLPLRSKNIRRPPWLVQRYLTTPSLLQKYLAAPIVSSGSTSDVL